MKINKKIVLISLSIIIVVSLFLHFYKSNQIPPCLNADEAAFGYNAYSLLKTGRDEYGKFLPLRLTSFKDYKLPLYSYLSIPIIAVLGLNDFSIRLLNVFVGIGLVILSYFLAKEIFDNKLVGLISAILVCLNPAVYLLSRQAQEGVLCTFFTLLALYFFIKFWKNQKTIFFLATNISILAASFSYHTARIFVVFFAFLLIYSLWKNRSQEKFINKNTLIKLVIVTIVVLLPFYLDYAYGNNRVTNLLFIQNKGFQLRLNEYLNEDGLRILHNKLTEAIRDITQRYFTQISTQFFLVSGDSNWRFGMPNLSIFTPVEFILFFIGLYYLFKTNSKLRFILLIFIALIPVNNALTWMDPALNRTYLIIFPFLYFTAYGSIQLINDNKKNKYLLLLVSFVVLLHSFYLINNWDLYFNHYPKRALTIRAWQCGYKEMTSFIKDNYSKYDKFYITDRLGDPYIFVLTYLQYDPHKYQSNIKAIVPDDYGFQQIEKFDKFDFNFKLSLNEKNVAFIGFPEHFKDLDLHLQKNLQKIKIGTEDMFWIYKN